MCDGIGRRADGGRGDMCSNAHECSIWNMTTHSDMKAVEPYESEPLCEVQILAILL